MKGKTVSIAQARLRLHEILETIHREPVTITKYGIPAAVVLAPDDYESLIATVELIRNPKAGKRLRELDQQRTNGTLEFVTHEEAEQELLA